MKRTIETRDAPAAVGAYSQAATDGSLLFTAGQIPLTPAGELLAAESVAVQTEQCLENIEGVLDAADLGFEDVLKVTVYLDSIDDFEAMNETYASYFESDPPARSAVAVDALPKGVAVEIEAIASHA